MSKARKVFQYLLLMPVGLALIGLSVWNLSYNGLSRIMEMKAYDADETVTQIETTPSDAPAEEYIEWTGYQQGSITSKSVKLKSAPSDSAKAVCKIEANSRITVIERRGEWARIRYRGYTGWVEYDRVRAKADPTQYDIASAGDLPAIEDLAGSDAQDALDRISHTYKCSIVQAAVIKDGEVRYTYEYGYADPKETVPIAADSKIRIASLSKLMVGMSAMAMCEQDLVSLSGDISDYLGYKVRNPRYPDTPITVHSLLTHTSSINEVKLNYDKPKSLKDTLSQKKTFSGNRPGLRGTFSYCNAAYNTAGAALESAAGMTLVDYTDRYFFDVLGIDASYYAPHIKDRGKIAALHSGKSVKMSVKDLLGRPYYEKPGQNFCFYAGGLIISAQDYARLLCILIGDGSYHGTYYLSPESVAKMQEIQYDVTDFDQCITLRHRNDHIDGRDLYYHTGNAYGVLSYASYDESTGDGVVIITVGSSVAEKSKGVYLPCKEMAEYIYGDLLHR